MITIYNDICENSDKYNLPEIDLFFCDPPYYKTSHKWDNQWKTEKDYLDWTRLWMQMAYNQLKNDGSMYVCISWEYSSYYHLILKDIGFNIKNRISWKRDKGRGSRNNWKSIQEDIWFVTKSNKYTFNIDDVMVKKDVIAPYRDKDGNPKGWWYDSDGNPIRMTHPGNYWDDLCVPFWSSKEVRSYAKTKRTPNNKYKKHPTQKPLDLVKRCILASSNKGEVVCDYFGGSGTTCIAAELLGRDSIIFEKDKEFVDIINTRIKNEIPDKTFF